MNYPELDTPALCVDIDRLDANIARLQSACDGLGISLRVHTKTHKTPAIARRQIAAGAVGIVSQKLGEAEAMAAAGLKDILVPYNIVGRRKLERLVSLVQSDRMTLTLAADSTATIEGISAAMAAAGCSVRLLVEMDTGSHRCGTQSPRETLELAQLGNALGKVISMTEKGDRVNGVGDSPNQHDILTGSQTNGRAYTDGMDHTCNNWTGNGTGSAQLGHSDKQGGNNGSWNSSHPSRGCGHADLVATGGAGLFYCFATN